MAILYSLWGKAGPVSTRTVSVEEEIRELEALPAMVPGVGVGSWPSLALLPVQRGPRGGEARVSLPGSRVSRSPEPPGLQRAVICHQCWRKNRGCVFPPGARAGWSGVWGRRWECGRRVAAAGFQGAWYTGGRIFRSIKKPSAAGHPRPEAAHRGGQGPTQTARRERGLCG